MSNQIPASPFSEWGSHFVGLKQKNSSFSLETAIPYEKRLRSKDQTFQKLISVCDNVTVLSKSYSRGCFFTRNRYMVDNSSWVLAVYDGREKGGTFYTIGYAKKQCKEIHTILL